MNKFKQDFFNKQVFVIAVLTSCWPDSLAKQGLPQIALWSWSSLGPGSSSLQEGEGHIQRGFDGADLLCFSQPDPNLAEMEIPRGHPHTLRFSWALYWVGLLQNKLTMPRGLQMAFGTVLPIRAV